MSLDTDYVHAALAGQRDADAGPRRGSSKSSTRR